MSRKADELTRLREENHKLDIRNDINKAITRLEEQKKAEAQARRAATKKTNTKAFWDEQLADFHQVVIDHNYNMELAVAFVAERAKKKSTSPVWKQLPERGLTGLTKD